MHTASSVSVTQLVGQLEWRYAAKKFDPNKIISPALWHALEKVLVLAPSSFGLQPWKFSIVTVPGLREELAAASYGQKQVLEASHLVVFSARRSVTPEDIDSYLKRIEEIRGTGAEELEAFRKRLVGTLLEGPRAQLIQEWTSQQAFIALGTFLTSAALLGVDACPMGGFNSDEYDRILGLEAKGFRSVVIAALGYRDESDPAASLPKVRFAEQDVIERFT